MEMKINIERLRKTAKKRILKGKSLNATAKLWGIPQPTLYRFIFGLTLAPSLNTINKLLHHVYKPE
jgi:hypothetical protein